MTVDSRIEHQDHLAHHVASRVLSLTSSAYQALFPTFAKKLDAETNLSNAEGLRSGEEWRQLSPSERRARLVKAQEAANELEGYDFPLDLPEFDEFNQLYTASYRKLEELFQLVEIKDRPTTGAYIRRAVKIFFGLIIAGFILYFLSNTLGNLFIWAAFIALVAVPMFMRQRISRQEAHATQIFQDLVSTTRRVTALQEEIEQIVLTNIANAAAKASAETIPAVRNLYESVPLVGWRWNAPGWSNWEPVTIRPGVTRVGELTYFLYYSPISDHREILMTSMTSVKQQLRDRLGAACRPLVLASPNEHYILPEESVQMTAPWLVSVPGGGNLLIKASGANMIRAMDALQSVMLRLLATVPPAKVRFTLIDPIGLGQNVAPLMRLADYDEQLVTSRAWSEPRHIEQRLTDLSEHIENVIQKYLRNDFATIEDYNEHADEVAEPYRVLVVMGFPVNFTDETARRLVSIATNGPRCGVSVLVAMDESKPLPYGFNLADLERVSTVIAQVTQDPANRDFVWDHPEFRDIGRLELDTPPPPALFNQIVQMVGERAQAANKVEVPFERIAPPSDQWWTADSRDGLTIPIGRAGANKFQSIELGQGTAHHALVAGQTGSGKSTLFHTIIMNTALKYSPHEVELYLVDFKEGVEFKPYVSQQLPHARVVAIESEREFGLSVLHGLYAELQRRGELFRSSEVRGIAEYRNKTGARMPRILLLVDEFQGFFLEDDRTAHESARLLDQMARLGRFAGIHVILGSQTLASPAGAYALPGTTRDQMAVRIALRSSDADARLILGDENAAARLLSRDGEAIYNAKNGLLEGNQLFQVARLPKERQRIYLDQISELAQRYNYCSPDPQVVFEGNELADMAKNKPFQELLASSSWPQSPQAITAWLGEPIAIKSPTAAHFRRQSGSNLLIVGQDPDAAMGMLITALVSVSAHHQPLPEREHRSARFCILDLGQADSTNAGLLKRVGEILPHAMRVVGLRHAVDLLSDIAAETNRRVKDDAGREAPIYLIVYGLQRARDLLQEDLYRSLEDGAQSPVQQFTTILREGPDVGVHTLIWCDTLGNIEKRLGRQSMREFDMRVALQMGSDDSSNLVDTPQASRLGSNRALFFSEDQSRLEKFRPYGIVSVEWLSGVGRWLAEKSVKSSESSGETPDQPKAAAASQAEKKGTSPVDMAAQMQQLIDQTE
jgi:S-DNA-T family DNA segregation ATPase FtsK/SpoIIIE